MKKFKLLTISLIILFGLSVAVNGQQVIGSFPTMDGGFEGQTEGVLVGTSIATGVQRTDWTTSSSNLGTIYTIGGRSGPRYMNAWTTSTGKRWQSPTAGEGAITNVEYTVQYYYRTSGTTATAECMQIGVSPDGTGSPKYYPASTPFISLPGTNGVWAKYSAQVTVPTAGGAGKYGIGMIRANTPTMGVALDIDDFVMYEGALDEIAPDEPISPVVSGETTTSLNISWTAPATGVDGGGYLVVRGSADPTTAPNVNGIYAIGNTIAAGEEVVYIGTATSFTDENLSSETTYYYRVYTVDKAFNYSAGVPVNGTTLGISGPDDPVPTLSGRTTTSLSFTWAKNAASDNVMLVYKTTDDIGTPVNGTTYAVGEHLADGATVLYNGGDQTSYTHSGLTPNTTYYYKFFSVDGSLNYSTGVSSSAKTLMAEPSNHAASFTATEVTYTSIKLTWLDNDGDYPAEQFLVVLETASGFAPEDGQVYSDIDANKWVKYVNHGVQTVTFTGLEDGVTYYAKIWPVSNTGGSAEYYDYKTDGTVPELSQATPAYPSLPFVENFDYTIGDLLTNHGWVAHSGAGNQSIDVTSGLVFDGYLGSGVGGAANLDNNGEDVHKVFDPVTADSIYASFIIQTESSNAAGYFLHLGKSEIGTTWLGRVWVNATGDGVAISSGSAPASYVPITAGKPTLLVVKYNLSTKISSLYVFDTFPTEEPATPNLTFTETSNFANVGSIALRQYNANQRVIVDGIRVAKTWAEAVAPAPLDLVSTPTFDPPAGNYYTTQNVTISTTTEGATIYYTTDGNDPTDSSPVYTVPIPVSSTTTIKAKAYKTGYTPSSVATAVYSFPIEVANIAALRDLPTGPTWYKLTGEAVLTFKSTTRHTKYIQDATGAILIDDYSGVITTPYNLYDGITGIIGSLQDYNGMLQFVPVTDPGPATSTGNAVAPVEVTLANLNTDYQAKLVKIKNVVISGTGNFAASTNYTITDVTGSGVIRTQYADLDYLGKPIPTTLQNLTGVVLQYQTTTQFIPRSLADFEDASLTQYRSKTSGNWTDASTWQKLVGSEWIDATSAPEGFSDYITIKAGDTVTVNDTLRIGSGAKVNVNGYLKNKVSIISNGTFVFTNGSIYEHAIDKDAIPKATWEEGATCLITGITGTSAPTGLNQEFYNFTWNCPSQSGNLNFNANLTTIKGDFNVLNTNGKQLRLGSVDLTVNIGGDVNIGQNALLTSSGSAGTYTITVNVGGDINISGGTLYLENAGSLVADWNLAGDLVMYNGTLGRQGSGTGNLNFIEGSHVFNRTGGTITSNNGGPIFNVKTGATLDLGTSRIEQGPFNLDSAATLICGNPGGLDSSLTTPRAITFSPYANYVFNCPSEQVTGKLLPAVVNNLTFESSVGDTLSHNVTVNGLLTVNSGYLEISGDTITLGPAAMLAETGGLVKGDGIMTTTRTLNNINAENVAGLGAVMTTTKDMGSTVVTRGHSANSVNGRPRPSIRRYYDILPTNNSGLNATLVFKYDESELGDLSESDKLVLFSRSEEASFWSERGGILDTANNQITLAGIDKLSRWTIGVHVNTPPSPVTMLKPTEGYVVTNSDIVQDSLIELKWSKAVDPDGEALTYNLFILKVDIDSIVVAIEIPDTSVLIKAPTYKDNGSYKVYVLAYDPWEAFSSSDTVNFTINLTQVGIKGDLIPKVFALHQNYPNPFNPITTIKYDLPKDVYVKLVIYDLMGREVRTLVNEKQQAGYQSIIWDARNNYGMQVSSGYYICVMQAGEFRKNQKMVLMK